MREDAGVDWKSAERFLLFVRPFERSAPIFYRGFYLAAEQFLLNAREKWTSPAFLTDINNAFQSQYSRLPNRPDPHLNVGVYANLRVRTKAGEPRRTRATLLLTRMMTDALEAEEKNNKRAPAAVRIPSEERAANRPRAFLPSPLFFLRQYLTAPDYPASVAYAHAALRAIILGAAIAFKKSRSPTINDTSDVEVWSHAREIIRFERIVETLDKMEAHRRKQDTFQPTDETDFLVMHHLAAKGLLHLSFAQGDTPYEPVRDEPPIMTRNYFLREGTLWPTGNCVYEFRRVDLLRALPSPAEIINEIDGIPVPVPGGGIVFAGGIRLTEKTGTVWRISGRSGTGKTSFALGVATALAPLGIATLYLSCEEEAEDLINRVETLVPIFVRRTESFIKFRNWFFPKNISGDPSDLNSKILDYFKEYVNQFGKNGQVSASKRPQGLVPALVVLDGVHELMLRGPSADNSGRLRKLVQSCRELGVLVLLLTASSEELGELDYLVDGVATLEIQGVEEKNAPPLRQFVIRKSRRQYSRSGAHTLHISPRSGIRITPQLYCQRDRLRDLAWIPTDDEHFLDVFRYAAGGAKGDRPELVDLVRIPFRSQILISGRGSSGKAGLGLRILLSGEGDLPSERLAHEDAEKTLFRESREARTVYVPPRRVLVVSFLYEQPYYEELAQDVRNQIYTNSRPGSILPSPEIETQHFYPGLLTPEDFIRKIDEKLEWAELHGAPFDGVLIDGIHNVFLQFPRLQETPLVWPVLFEMLRKRGTTVVVTHTHFDLDSDINESRFARFAADISAIAGRVEPLLHALVSSADFYIELRRPPGHTEGQPSEFDIVFRTATGQTPRARQCRWQRQNLRVAMSGAGGGEG